MKIQQSINKELIQTSIKTGVHLSFAIAYWFVFGLMILIGGIAKGIGLGIVLFIISFLGYKFIVKMTKFMIKKQQNN